MTSKIAQVLELLTALDKRVSVIESTPVKTSTKVSTTKSGIKSTYKVDELLQSSIDTMVVRHPYKLEDGQWVENQDKMLIQLPSFVSREAFNEFNMIAKQSGGRCTISKNGNQQRVAGISYNGTVPQDVVDLFVGMGVKIEGI